MAKKTIAFICAILLGSGCFSQLVFASSKMDLGVLRRADPNWIDFELRNQTEKPAVIFRVEGSENVDTKMSKKTIEPGGVGSIRVAVTPTTEGKFEEELLVYASSWYEPRSIIIVGTSTYESSTLIPCPNFGDTRSRDGQFHFSIRQQNIAEAADDAEIRVYRNGRQIETLRSNGYGEVSTDLPYGRYYFVIESEYTQLDTAMYVNAVNNHLLAVLQEFDRPNLETIVLEAPQPAIPRTEILVEPKESQIEPGEVIPENLAPENEELPLSKFKKNNLVFLVDVSSSMKSNGKIDLLKISMIELLEVLRDVDRFSLVSYASGIEVLIETDGNLNREACIETIMQLEAKGSTAGAEAIKKAAELALSHYIEGGNNQVILATDGAFNDGVNRASRIARNYKEKGVDLSVIGIRCAPYTEKEMKELVENSEGRYIPIRSDTQAGDQLISEIKKSSKR